MCRVNAWGGGRKEPPKDIKALRHNGGMAEFITSVRHEFEKIANEWERTKDLCKKLIKIWLLRYNGGHRDIRVRAGGGMDGRAEVSRGSMTDRNVK